ncbi:hypothetical protein YC2023_122915 [Brassica napus]
METCAFESDHHASCKLLCCFSYKTVACLGHSAAKVFTGWCILLHIFNQRPLVEDVRVCDCIALIFNQRAATHEAPLQAK